MSLKVIAGIYGSRVLKSVRGLGTRPLLGQVKESIFNILAEHVPGAFVWDLFAGTGATGIEALSRGAERVLFCEKNNKALEILRGNLHMLGADALQRSVVLRTDAWDPPVMHRAAFGAGREGDGVGDIEVAPDLIFLDPPYSLVEEDPAKSVYRARQLARRLAPGGCVVFHFQEGILAEDDFDADLEVDLREYGDSAVAILWRSEDAPARVRARREQRGRAAEE
jgi:16S rRNA (guanine966-N2)-methyltransferase